MQNRAQITRARIMEESTRLFSQNGYDATGVAEICQAAGVSKGAFYHHFESKHSVFLAILDEWLARVDTRLEDLRGHIDDIPSALEGMAAVVPSVFADANGKLSMFLEFWARASRDESVWQAAVEPYRRYQRYFSALIESARQKGMLNKNVDSQQASWLLLALATGILLQGLVVPDAADWEKTAREGIRALLKN